MSNMSNVSFEKNGTFEVSLKLILKNKEGKILALIMPDTSTSMPGYYDFPGGRIRAHEALLPFSKIISREIREELGSEVKLKINEVPVAVGRHVYFSKKTKKNRGIFWIFFEAEYIGGNIRISKEHSAGEWLKINKKNIGRYFKRGPLEGMEHYFYKKFPHHDVKVR